MLERLRALKQEHPSRVRSIHGSGLFISIHLQIPATGEPDVALADAVVAEAVRRGVLMFPTGRGFLKFTPPLCIEPEAALEAASVICESSRRVCRVNDDRGDDSGVLRTGVRLGQRALRRSRARAFLFPG